MLYRPRLSDGRLAPVSWQIRLAFLNVYWPLEDNSTLLRRNLDKILIISAFIMLLMCNAAIFNYIIYNINCIEMILDAIVTYMALIEEHLRTFNIALRKQAFKKFLKEFYAKIYIERDSNVKVFRQIKRSMLPTVLNSYIYISTLAAYLIVPVIGLFADLRLLPFKMVLPYDITPMYFYIPTLIVNNWVGVYVESHIVSECNLLATIILHLNGQYQLLKQDIENLYASSLHRSDSSESFIYEFRQGLVRIIQRNVELNEFAAKLQKEYSFRVFVLMALSSLMLCVLGFMVVTIGMSSKAIHYVAWIVGKIVELLIFGELGSKLIFTTNEMSSMYYMSNWENVVLQSTNSLENKQLMKLIALAIELNQKPKIVSGLNFFDISLETVMSILRASFSYFSCLYALR